MSINSPFESEIKENLIVFFKEDTKEIVDELLALLNRKNSDNNDGLDLDLEDLVSDSEDNHNYQMNKDQHSLKEDGLNNNNFKQEKDDIYEGED